MQESNKPYKGLFITVEGGEGSGKTSICKELASQLVARGYEVVQTREPGGSPLSELLRTLLLNPEKTYKICDRAELLLFLAARVQHIEECILPALCAGKIVICDRFNDSTIAYQGCARHLGKSYVEKLCQLSTEELAEPHCTLFLDLDPKIGMQRVNKSRKNSLDRMEQEALPFHQEVRQGYLHLADQYADRFEIIDAEPPLEEVLASCLKALEPHLMLKPARS